MRTFMMGLAAAFAILFLSAAPAAADTIECPLSQARRTVTNDLPSGWWTTPIVNNLSETRIQEIGGETALVCVYGASGSVQRNAPANQTCTARTGGFDCAPRIRLVPLPRPTPSPAPATHSTGPLSVPQTYVFDLDAGSVGGEGDIWFQAVTASQLFLTPRGGAQMAVGDGSNRGLAGCSAASFSATRVALSEIPVGSYVCVRTSEGRISQFRMNAISSGSPKTLTLGYTTWQ
ncbi:MAG TPA: hypothetical protein VEA80_20045 [Vitreimonas sp.]|uniref:hypothetical protein n=1 Tax=Vitreimonas sp. TaxID=3069702 RepID=UPI002D734B95|nr:hypothetical protein [Vitreimonas sp.]HYD89783.1 hypothetical protein [Vitreimonas sp.]